MPAHCSLRSGRAEECDFIISLIAGDTDKILRTLRRLLAVYNFPFDLDVLRPAPGIAPIGEGVEVVNGSSPSGPAAPPVLSKHACSQNLLL